MPSAAYPVYFCYSLISRPLPHFFSKVGEESGSETTSIRGTGRLSRFYYLFLLLPEKGSGSGRGY